MPIGTAAAILGGAAISGLAGALGSSSAAHAQTKAANAASATDERIFDKQTALQEPFRQAGITADNRLLELLGIGGDASAGDYGKYSKDFGMSDFQQDPGYQFRLSEGLKAINNSMAAQGRGISGANLKAAANYGQEAGSQEYQNAFNRYQVNRSNQLNPLQSIAGAGQTATNALTNAAGQLGQNVSDNQLEAGNARASGYVGTANALTAAIGGGVNSYLGYQASQPLNNYLNSLTKASTASGSSGYGQLPNGGYRYSPGELVPGTGQPVEFP